MVSKDDTNRNYDIHFEDSLDRSVVIAGDGNTVTYNVNIQDYFKDAPYPPQQPQPLSSEERRCRQTLIADIKHDWIEGILERSLNNQAMIELGLEQHNSVVNAQADNTQEFPEIVKTPANSNNSLTTNISTNIFSHSKTRRTLLIFGKPGSGKTTILLKLVKTLVARIETDYSQPIPIVLNLSSWAIKKQKIEQWLIQSLNQTFRISQSRGRCWLNEGQLILCLDGLDEVAIQHRNACVKALNEFMRDYGNTELVICSRIRDYEMLVERLDIRTIIHVQPLTYAQIDHYLKRSEDHLSALRTVLRHSPAIRNFATSPLILSVMSLAYQGCSLEDIPDADDEIIFRKRLFDAYITRMLQRRKTTHRYRDNQVKRWLTWIAKGMVQSSQTVFFIENIQPDWFQNKTLRLRYRIETALIYGLVVGLIGALSYRLSYGRTSSWQSYGLWVGLISALFSAVLREIKPVEEWWSWRKAMATFWADPTGGLTGLISGLIFGLVYTLFESIGYGILMGLSAMLLTGLMSGLMSGLQRAQRTTREQRIWQSVTGAGIRAILHGLAFGGFTGLAFGKRFGLIAGLIYGLLSGGSACIRHVALRLLLLRMGYAPWNYTRFLDYATERIFLRQVGDGYVFMHRTLLEHFSQMKL